MNSLEKKKVITESIWNARHLYHFRIFLFTFFFTVKPTEFPKVVIGIFIENPTPFFEEFLHKFLALSYPKDKIHLYIHNGVGFLFYELGNDG